MMPTVNYVLIQHLQIWTRPPGWRTHRVLSTEVPSSLWGGRGRGGTTPRAQHRTFSRGPRPAASTARANSGGVNTQEPYCFPLLTYPSLTTIRLGSP